MVQPSKPSSTNANKDLTLERSLPHNLEAERAILGAILLDSSLCNQAIEMLKVDDFFFDSHRRIYEKMLILSETAQAIDIITLQEELFRTSELEQIGGVAYLASLLDGAIRMANIESYAKIIKGKSIMRRLITASNQIIHTCMDQESDPYEILDDAEKMIFEIADDRIRTGFVSISEIARVQLELVEKASQRPELMTGIPTGFTQLDRLTNGLQRSDLVIIAARPSVGKCLAHWTLIDDPLTGERLTIQECISKKLKTVFGVSEKGIVRQTEISNWIDSGIKPCYEVRTGTGRVVAVTGHHPFLTVNGWQPLNELSVGRSIAVPRSVPVFGTDESWSLDLVRLLAYFIAEGNLTNTTPRFTNTDPILVADFKEIIDQHFPQCAVKVDKTGITYSVARPERGGIPKPNPVTQWLKSIGMMGKLSKEKFFPSCVWTWPKSHLSEFIRILMSCDGSIYRKNGHPAIELTVASKRLANDFHHALIRFGIVGKFFQTSSGAWRVQIFDSKSVKSYQEQIGWMGEKELRFTDKDTVEKKHPSNKGHAPKETWLLLNQAMQSQGFSMVEIARQSGETTACGKYGGYNAHINRTIPSNRLLGYAKVLKDSKLEMIASKDIYWDEIVSIEYIGDHQVYDLTVPDGSNFIAQDICVHNTAFGLSIAQNASVAADKVIGVFSLEMTKEALVSRLLCSESQVDAHKLRGGFLNREEWARLGAGLQTISQAKIFIDDTAGISILEMRAKARRLKAEHGLDLLIVDYLQLVRGRGRIENRQQEVSQISRDLKGLAKELDVPLVALSQLSRAPEARTDHRPHLADLRESGSIEQDADVVMFIYREEIYNPTEENQGQADIIIGKQRNGPIDTVKLAFIKQFTRFENLYT